MSKSLYEVMFVLDPEKVEGNGEAVDAAIQAQLKEFGGEISRVKFLEKRTFARPMGKHKVGLYWDYIVEIDGTVPAQSKEKYRLNPQVLRIGIFHWKPGQDDEVFKPRDEKIFGEESFQDQYDNDNYRSRGNNRGR